MEKPQRRQLVTTLLRYLARALSTGAAAFILMFVIGGFVDTLIKGKPMTWTAEGVWMTVYSCAIALGAILAYWRDLLAGALLTLVGVAFLAHVLISLGPNDYWITLVFSLPFLLSGVLLLVCRRRTSSTPRQKA